MARSTTRGGIGSEGIGLRRERLGRWLLGSSFVLFVGSIAVFTGSAGPGSSPSLREIAEPLAVTGVGVALLVLLLGLLVRHLVIRRRGRLRIGPEHLIAELEVPAASADQAVRPLRTLEIPFRDIEAGWATSPDGRWFAELRLRSGTVLSVVVPDRELAQQIVSACGVGPNRRALRMKVGGTTPWLTIAYPGLLVGILPCALGAYLLVDLGGVPAASLDALTFLLAALALVGWVAAWMRVLGPPWVVVGQDGVTVESGFRPRFIAYEKLERVRRHDDGITLELVGGRVVQLRVSSSLDSGTSAVMARIDEARFAWLGRPDGPNAGEARLELLDRGDRSIAEWRAALSKLREKAGGYRGRAGLRDHELLDVLGDVRAPAERKIGAALALAGQRDPDVHRRIAVAAAATANEPLRRALDALASGDADADAISEALAACELGDEDPEPSSPRTATR